MSMISALEKDRLEAVGEPFNVARMLEVRAMTRDTIHAIAAAMKPGMIEEEAVELAKDMLAERSLLRGWHDVYVRFGSNTIKTFGATSEPGIVLGESDIFFFDIGPVFEQWEGDGGETFTVGDDPLKQKCASDAKALFHTVRRKWQAERITGKALYDFATVEARGLGWELNLDLSGHRLSDFPHAAAYDGPLADVDFTPSPLLWVLEIHIRHPENGYGAFYEDMLLDDSYFV